MGIRNYNIPDNAAIEASKITGLINHPKTYYVSRNVGTAGDGSTWKKAFKTLGAAITQVNADYTDSAYIVGGGRDRLILVSEGWYSEVGTTLTASDVTIMSIASGSRISDGTVLYGSATAGGWDAGAVAPALTVTGSAVSFVGMGFMNSASGLYPCISVGESGSSGPTDVSFRSCFFPRDVADAYTYAIVDYSNEGGLYKDCYFSQSAKTGGILIASNGVTNPVNSRIIDSLFQGTPVGVHQTAGHNTIIKGNWFIDTSDDRADTIDNPINIVATSAFTTGNYAPMNTLAEFDAGSVAVNLGNMCSDSDNADWPQGG